MSFTTLAFVHAQTGCISLAMRKAAPANLTMEIPNSVSTILRLTFHIYFPIRSPCSFLSKAEKDLEPIPMFFIDFMFPYRPILSLFRFIHND